MPSKPITSPPGQWPSPITAKNIAQGIGLSNSLWDSDGKTLVWTESRSDRTVLVASHLNGDAPRDLTDDLSVRARLGYGGGDFCAGAGHAIFVSGGRLHTQQLDGGKARAITPAFGDAAAPCLSPNGKWVLYVFSAERKDGLALTDVEGKLWPQKVAEGHDFFMQPTFNHTGKLAAWVAWDHPQMPWDGARLYLAEVHEQSSGLPFFKNERALAGREDVAVFQPEFSPDGKYLSYLSDESGWHNLYLYDVRSQKARKLTHETQAQLGSPAWVQGLRTYGWSHDSKYIYCIRNQRGASTLVRYDVTNGRSSPVKGLEEYTDLQQPALNPCRATLAVVGSSGKQPARLLVLDLSRGSTQIVKRATTENVPPSALIAAQPVQWTTKKQTIHGLLYLPDAPASRNGRKAALPPAIVRIHGGPTSQARAGYTGDTQFFATRGYTVLDVNYRGSTGYGRSYMNALRGQWGVCDVDDAISAAQFLIQKGYADPQRLVILGGSAGGFTVLLALALHPHVFKAGICLYGVTDLFSLAADTHKMEERYLDTLVGPLPDRADLYRERSPRFHADTIKDPVAIFHGSKDEVVPLSQSDAIVASLKRRGIPHEYHVYEGEGHGWRKKETVEAYYAAVEKFLARHVLFA
jgi:dipeptidyl aminopeptidase/acylaminoacyl peptidase